MRKISLVLVIAIIFTAIGATNVLALNVGDKLGDVLNTDVKAYINGERIPCYNIDGKAVVLVADLRNYGFDVVYDGSVRSSSVTRNHNKQFTPIRNIANNTAQVGSIAFSYVYTDIIAIVNGKRVDSFNVQGNLAIFFSALGDYGRFVWDAETKSSKLALSGTSNEKPDSYVSPVEAPTKSPSAPKEKETVNEKSDLSVPTTEAPTQAPTTQKITDERKPYVITMTGAKYHYPTCRTVKQIKQYVTAAEAERMGYTACKVCKPR